MCVVVVVAAAVAVKSVEQKEKKEYTKEMVVKWLNLSQGKTTRIGMITYTSDLLIVSLNVKHREQCQQWVRRPSLSFAFLKSTRVAVSPMLAWHSLCVTMGIVWFCLATAVYVVYLFCLHDDFSA